jgi:hypothetical protein
VYRENISHGVDVGERVLKGMKDLDEVVICSHGWHMATRSTGCAARPRELHKERVDGRPYMAQDWGVMEVATE